METELIAPLSRIPLVPHRRDSWRRRVLKLDYGKRGDGHTKTRAYHIWQGMFVRCYDHRIPSYRYYGAKGVRICRRWASFWNFFSDVGEPPPGKSIDRIDPHGHYEPSNVRWATPQEQARNKRNRVVSGLPSELTVLPPR